MSLKLDTDSVVLLLNFILNNIKEDRKMALTEYSALSNALELATSQDILSTIESQLIEQNISKALSGFLDSASKSTDNAIKVCKLLSDHLIKNAKTTKADEQSEDDEFTLSDIDRKEIENKVVQLQKEQQAISKTKDKIGEALAS